MTDENKTKEAAKLEPIKGELSAEEIKRRIALHAGKITRQLQGESGTVGLSALAYAMVACAKSIGVSEQDCVNAIKMMWESYSPPKPSGG